MHHIELTKQQNTKHNILFVLFITQISVVLYLHWLLRSIHCFSHIQTSSFSSSISPSLTSCISSWPISSSVLFSSSCCSTSSWPRYTAQCINCGLKNSQLRLGGIVEANDSELQGKRVKAWTPYRSCSILLILPYRPEGVARWHSLLRTGSWFTVISILSTPPAHINILTEFLEDNSPDFPKSQWYNLFSELNIHAKCF